jgi:hypothetical protein
VTGGAPVAHLTPGLDTSSGRDMTGTVVKPADSGKSGDKGGKK